MMKLYSLTGIVKFINTFTIHFTIHLFINTFQEVIREPSSSSISLLTLHTKSYQLRTTWVRLHGTK